MRLYIGERTSEFTFKNEDEMDYIINELEKSIHHIEQEENNNIFTKYLTEIKYSIQKWKDNAIYVNEDIVKGEISTTLNHDDTGNMFISLLFIMMLKNTMTKKHD